MGALDMIDRIANFIAGLVEGRDPDLAGHHQRLGSSAERFGLHLGCTSEEVSLLCLGAEIHDLGKLSISDHILNKPARLTASEFSLIKQHADIGADLLSPLDLDPRVNDLVRFHHENYDGTGYPQGLKGDEIPFFARLARILDSFDAMIMNRPYHKGVSTERALRRMEQDSHCYDPNLLHQFFQSVKA
ncbi:HD-GYP domain-containing protein [Thioalkalivibrio sulfidiphilus]|uniref:Putative metal dependent phosphohydrolase n=1 Tax=Thioalkalivibrio sulfidiphilus (strain HL-EbGR7) TaxID=396588 RepID=B8GSJ9_THISH|nr:HD domain-containing phosphohydrolase [Thioalkalivibrio sulfidiphilus]ACL72903.1 putative metal dependent phosphohydrolase [Thioalkalivibrio sulfidiphilus HL-EbGr7]